MPSGVSTVYLVRHGQASYGAADYDVLSELGAEQSRRLGAYLASGETRVDAIYCGPASRHRDTATSLRAGAAEGGLDLAEPTVVAALDEYPAFALFRRWLPELATRRPEIAAALTSAGPGAAVQEALEQITMLWAAGELDTGELESFVDFRDRVCGALAAIRRSEGRGKRVLVVTSGGPVAIGVQAALELSPRKTLGLAWVIANASITEFRYRDAEEASLIAFNRVPHLQGSGLLTYR